MDKNAQKTIFAGLFMLAIGMIFISPILIKGKLALTALKYGGFFVLFVAIIILVSGDKLFKLMFKYKDQYEGMTPEQILNNKRQEYKYKMDEEKLKLELESQRLNVERKRAEIDSIRAKLNQNKQSPFPDILGNLQPYMSTKPNNKKQDDEFRKWL